jgi:hypothetical protein
VLIWHFGFHCGILELPVCYMDSLTILFQNVCIAPKLNESSTHALQQFMLLFGIKLPIVTCIT